MKKKLLSVLLVLCMVLTLMPMAALADFADTEGHWGKDAIDRWADVGVLNGKGDGIFDPNGGMTRAEFAQMLCNLMGYTKKAPNTFVDVPDDAWYADAILKLVQAGVINGTSATTASPNAPITREQAAVMLARAFDLKASNASLSFADADNVSDWARGAIAALTEKGMMNGVGDNKVAPQLNINRASVATLINNMVAEYVTEDKVITGEVNGIIVVAGNAKVTLEDATVNAPIIVAPKAEGAEVELTGETTAENVVVAAGSASVAVGENATVDTVAVTGEDATIAVSGTVASVEVAEGADKAEITTTETAKIDSVTTSAEDVKVSGTGEVGTVTADAGSVDVTTKDTEVKNEGADSVTNNGETVAPSEGSSDDNKDNTTTPSTGGSSSGGGSSSSSSNDAGVVAAPIVDNANPTATGIGTVSVSSVKASTWTEAAPVYDVVITGTNIKLHKNSEDADGHWVGFGVPTEAGKSYAYSTGKDSSCTVGGKTYDTFYYNSNTEAGFSNWNATLTQTCDGKTTTYRIKFKVTFGDAVDIKVVAAPLKNHPVLGTPATETDENLGTVVVKATKAGDNIYGVEVIGYEIKPHINADSKAGCWVGFGMPIKDDGTYSYKVMKGSDVLSENLTSVKDRVWEDANHDKYNTIYFDEEGSYTIEQSISGVAGAPEKITYKVKVIINADIQEQGASERPAEGPVKGALGAGDGAKNYAQIYEAVGLSFNTSTKTINVVKTKLEAAGADYVTALTNATTAYYGIQFDKPSDATSMRYASSLENLTSDTASDYKTITLTSDSTSEDGDVLNGQYIEYYQVGTVADSAATALESHADSTRYFMWMNGQQVLKISVVTISWDFT